LAATGLVAAGLASGFGAAEATGDSNPCPDVLDDAAAAAGFAGAGDFNGFDEVFCEALELLLLVCLVAFLLALPVGRAFETGFFAEVDDFARAPF
jgi:hypothetical protein